MTATRKADRHPKWLRRTPSWLRSAVSDAHKRGEIRKPFTGQWSKHDATYWLCNEAPGRLVLDHWGSDRDALISEPYLPPSDPKLIAHVEVLARVLGCDYLISRHLATWSPGWTSRIEFWPKGTALSSWGIEHHA